MSRTINLPNNKKRFYMGVGTKLEKRVAEAPTPDVPPEVLKSSNDFRTFWIELQSDKVGMAVESDLPPTFGSRWIKTVEVKDE